MPLPRLVPHVLCKQQQQQILNGLQSPLLCVQTKEHSFQGKGAAEWAKLRRLQTDLEAETGNACFLGLSLADTLRQCIALGNHRAAGRVRAEFKISDRRFWWIKVRT